MRLSLRPSSIPPSATEIFEAVKGLRAEVEVVSDPSERAVLLHEIGVLEELHRDDHAAAKDLLGAVNSATNLREPLEHLIALVQRRQSFQNLGKLLDRLGRVVSEPEEVARAQIARGNFLADQRNDDEAARQAYTIAEQTGVLSTVTWLSLELLAHKIGDAALARRVLEQRAQATVDRAYGALLRLRLAQASLGGSEHEAAIESLKRLADEVPAVRELALTQLWFDAVERGNTRGVAEISEARARHLEAQLSEGGDEAVVELRPAHATKSMAAELRLLAATKCVELGEHDRALAHLTRAEEVLGNNPAILAGMLETHTAAGNALGVSQTAERLLQLHDVSGHGRAALLSRAALAEASRGQTQEALALLRRALESDRGALSAHAQRLHLLLRQDDPAALADAFEASAASAPDANGRATNFARAALFWSLSKGNAKSARAALAQASSEGIPTTTALRWARFCASASGDGQWLRDASERLLHTADVEERHSAWLGLARAAYLRGDMAAARSALGELGRNPEGAWLAAMLTAYEPTDTNSEPADIDAAADALERLAGSSERREGQALAQIVAFRLHRAGKLEAAIERLSRLHDEHPADVTVGAQLAQALLAAREGPKAANVLSETGDATAYPELAAALKLEAGIVAWHGGARADAVEYFEAAGAVNSAASSGLLHWALRALDPDSLEKRRQALEVALDNNGDVDVYALERFALSLGPGELHRHAATEGLDAADDVPLGESGDAVQLARALWSDSSQHAAALRHLETHSDEGREIARGLRFLDERQLLKPDPQRLLELSAGWAETNSVAGQLEWLAAAINERDIEQELAAREQLADHLSGSPRAALDAGTALIHFIAQGLATPLLESSAPECILANLETSPPGCDPRRRALALSAVGELASPEAEATHLALAGYNELLAQKPEAALASFRAVVKALPDDIAGWEGVRLAAEQLERRELEAQACLRLGDLTEDRLVAARFLRQAASLLLDDLQDPERGNLALERAVQLDVSHRPAFKRWYGVLKERGEASAIVTLLGRRIEVSNDASELTALYWDRARARRTLDELDAALEELDNLNLLDADHVGAHALRGEIYIRQEKYEQAAAQLAELAALDAAPREQRLMSGVAAVDLFETKLNDLSRALEVLQVLSDAGLETLAVTERLTRAAATAERWEDAASLLEKLIAQRETTEGRVDAARLLMAIARDKLESPRRAREACEALLAEAPTDPEGIDFVLDGSLSASDTAQLTQRIRNALLEAPLSDLDEEQVARTARVAEALDDLSLRQAALGALVTLGVNNEDMRRELAELDERSLHHPQIALGSEELQTILAPDDSGPFAELFRHLGAHLPEVLGPTLKTLGVGRRQRLKPPMGAELRSTLAAFTGAFGLGDFELYVGGNEPNTLTTVPDPKLPAFVVGQAVQPTLTENQRWSLAQQVLALLRGTTVLLQRDVTDVAALAAAACSVGKHPLKTQSYSMFGEFSRALERELPRRVRKELTPIAEAVAASGVDPADWASAARTSLDRAAALFVGDVSWVILGRKERETQHRNFDATTEERIWSLLRFVLSTDFMRLRAKLGMAPR